jgi:hypothetical protein
MAKRLGRRIYKKELANLLQDAMWEEKKEFSTQSSSVYLHPDSRLLIDYEGKNGRLFEANESQAVIDSMLRTQKQLAEHPFGQHVLEGRLPHGLEFPDKVPALIAELPSLLKLPPEAFNYSMESLPQIDRKLKRLGRVKCTTPPVFPALVAYTGELLLHRYKSGYWRMVIGTWPEIVWEPWLVRPDGRVCNLALNLFDAFNEDSLSLEQALGGPYVWWQRL